MVVSSGIESDTVIKNDFIEIKPTLNADFSVSATSGYVPIEIKFADSSKGNIIGWFWQFGDSETSFDQNPVHTYSYPGEYTVQLRVFDEFYDTSVVKVKLIKCLQEGTGIETISHYFKCHSYPNPGSGSITIEYYIDKSSYVKLAIYNSLGGIVQSAIGEWQLAGEHQYRFSDVGLSQGIYFYKLEADGEIRTGNLVLVK